MKKLSVSLIALTFFACKSVKDTGGILQNIRSGESLILQNYSDTIRSGDRLAFKFSSPNEQALKMFVVNGTTEFTTQVNNEGNIYIPGLLTQDRWITAAGLPLDSLRYKVEEVFKAYLPTPHISVTYANYSVLVLSHDQQKTIPNVPFGKINVLEALSQCGVLNKQQSSIITVLRKEKLQLVSGKIDISDTRAFTSPYFYLRQNDMVILHDESETKKKAERMKQILSYITSAASVITLISSLLK